MKRTRSPSQKSSPRMRGERRQLLVYVLPELIKETKRMAVDLEITSSAAVEEALQDWLAKHAKKAARQKR